VTSNDIINFQTYVILIFAIELFRQFDEFGDVHREHFMPAFFKSFHDRIESLFLWVQGKSDKQKVHFHLLSYEEYPEFDVASLVLIYIHCAGIKGGYLFPSKEELALMPSDSICTTKVTYKWMRQRLAPLIKTVLGRGDMKLGTHLAHKTAYLKVLWGWFEKAHKGRTQNESETNVHLSVIMHSARHDTIKNAKLYMQDASTLYRADRLNKEQNNRVPDWEPIRFDNIKNLEELQSVQTEQAHVLPLPELATLLC
jgi:hypothetical protein